MYEVVMVPREPNVCWACKSKLTATVDGYAFCNCGRIMTVSDGGRVDPLPVSRYHEAPMVMQAAMVKKLTEGK
jgi:hypothetical protein